MYLLDTNTLIYFFKGMGNVEAHLFAHVPKEIFVPSLVVYELEVGIAKSAMPHKRQQQLTTLLSQITVIDFTQREARAAATIRDALETQGAPIGPIDTLIAGCALANRLTLVTHNTREFGRIEGLRLEDWF